MPYEIALNALWVACGIAALAILVYFDRQSHTKQTRRTRLLRVVAVSLVVFALFPYISASDDILHVEYLDSLLGQPPPGKTHHFPTQHSLDLLRLYESLEHSIHETERAVVVVFCFFALVAMPLLQTWDGLAPVAAGRAPPISSQL